MFGTKPRNVPRSLLATVAFGALVLLWAPLGGSTPALAVSEGATVLTVAADDDDDDDDDAGVLKTRFRRLDPAQTDPQGNHVLANCGGAFLDATARMKLFSRGPTTRVEIRVRDSRPNTFFTVWLRLRGRDPMGDSFGGSPLTRAGVTPLAPSSHLDELLTATGPGNGSTDLMNGFFTNGRGHGTLLLELDFPMLGGAYPFQRFEAFDPTDDRFPIEDPRIFPVAIVGPEAQVSAPFMLRLASHCLDDVGHGLMPGPHEVWFDWPD